jgi:hypothetical protein
MLKSWNNLNRVVQRCDEHVSLTYKALAIEIVIDFVTGIKPYQLPLNFHCKCKLITWGQFLSTSITSRRQNIVQESQELAFNLIEKHGWFISVPNCMLVPNRYSPFLLSIEQIFNQREPSCSPQWGDAKAIGRSSIRTLSHRKPPPSTNPDAGMS